ncbi:MAG: hypothetical protein R3C03_20435 [Pirellulaceae bacterium]
MSSIVRCLFVAILVAYFPLANDTLFAQQDEPSEVASEWVDVDIEDQNVSFQMPTEPESVERSMSPVPEFTTTVHMRIANVPPTSSFVFSYNKLPETPSTAQKIKETLEGGVKGAVARTLGTVVSVKDAPVAKHSGRRFLFECIQGGKRTRFLYESTLDYF